MSKVIWSDFASQSLRDVHDYYKEAVSSSVAKRIRQSIFSATRQLINHPESGQIEENLLQLNESHRYIVVNNYKIVYKRIKEGVLITDVFDTRQDPVKINKPERKRQK